MAPLVYFSFRKVFLLYIAFFVLISLLFCASIHSHELQTTRSWSGDGRRLLELDEEDEQLLLKKKSSSLSPKKNETMLIKSSNLSTKNQTKLIKSLNISTKNQTKLLKSPSNLSAKNHTKLSKTTNSTKSLSNLSLSSIPKLKKLNSTASKATNSSKITKTSDLLKLSPSKNKTTTKTLTDSAAQSSKTQKSSIQGKTTTQIQKQQRKQPSWMDEEDESDLVAEFRDLPTKFQENLIPDLERISKTSKVYITKYNKEFTKQFKPYVGNKHAPTIATVISCAFLLLPLLLVSLIFNRIKAYFSLQKMLIFIQIYLSIYFSILCLTSLVTGLEPLKFFYATSPSTYVCLQVLQTLGYVLYLLLLLMYLILVFSTVSGLGSKMLGLGQIFVGFAVGLHYYVAVFHRVVLHQPPKTNWKVHGMYATCFLVICLFATADRRKKAYLEEGGEEGKKN
ncbi:hypothetical protein F3Y22_tig00110387pilonHSYRG00438 [Hibiscus syriacus]|uniref:Uncharacterized protein n=1 Tax=Hibiscus syriacus TaxID=106335 RepID=A0A6A3AVX5_HIBSY|nr:uncharacterized protein LOC120122424 [Hibiscus syriacus]XP_038997485.1 uncharacterized protein LOC120122424 [Hibiscus syriacus]KAE8706969.1 hypothetical protein F3Y22_tig00110387pilonHSYRG00438 [Hibiscus syriacus]